MPKEMMEDFDKLIKGLDEARVSFRANDGPASAAGTVKGFKSYVPTLPSIPEPRSRMASYSDTLMEGLEDLGSSYVLTLIKFLLRLIIVNNLGSIDLIDQSIE